MARPLCLAFVSTWVLLAVASVSAQGLRDDFDGSSIDATKWNIDPGGGSIVVANGRATLSAPCGARFPHLTPRTNPFPAEGDFVVRVGFRYPYVGIGGNGFGFGYSESIICVWQDACHSPDNPYGCGGLRACVGDGPQFYVTPRDVEDMGYHVFEWKHIGGLYRFSVDGVEVAQDACSARPNQFFLGHPPYPYCDWTTQEIDFVYIEPLGATATVKAGWGTLKVRYR